MALTQVSRGLLSTSIVDNGNATAITIDSSENVGIGTASPSAPLEISTSSGDALKVTTTTGRADLWLTDTDTTAGQVRLRGDANNLVFITNTTEAMRIDSSGQLSLATTEDKARMTIGLTGVAVAGDTDGATMGENAIVHLLDSNAGATNSTVMLLGGGSGVTGQIKSGIGFSRESAANWGTQLRFYTHSTSTSDLDELKERMRIDASGNVGIGVTNAADYYANNLVVGAGSEGGITIASSATTYNNYLAFADSSSGVARYAGLISYDHNINDMHFRTNSLERIRIDSSGNLLVGTTTTGPGAQQGVAIAGGATSSDVYIRHANGTSTGAVYAAFIYNTSQIGSITQNGTTAVLYNTSSDQRLKDNIVDAPSASNDIDAIQVRSFDWKSDGSHQKYGMVAQELQSVAPEAVSGDADSEEMMGVDYSKLVPIMLKEIQSLRARVQQLENN